MEITEYVREKAFGGVIKEGGFEIPRSGQVRICRPEPHKDYPKRGDARLDRP